MRLATILHRVEKQTTFVYGVRVRIRGIWRRARRGRRWWWLCVRVGMVERSVRGAGIMVRCTTVWRNVGSNPRRCGGIAVFFAYRMRRVNCDRCGVTVELVPWCDGKHSQTTRYRWILAKWAQRLSWSAVATIFGTSWDSVCRAVEHAVDWGLTHRDLSGVTALGIDETAWQKGHQYLTLVYDISGSVERLLSVTEERTEARLRAGLSSPGPTVCARVPFVCSDMRMPYLTVIGEQLSSAVHVLDRLHIMQKFGKALDEIRAKESKQLKRDGDEPVLTKSRWCLLKRPANLTDRQTVKLPEVLKYNLRKVRAYLLREEFQQFWTYTSPSWAGKFLDTWTTRVMRLAWNS